MVCRWGIAQQYQVRWQQGVELLLTQTRPRNLVAWGMELESGLRWGLLGRCLVESRQSFGLKFDAYRKNFSASEHRFVVRQRRGSHQGDYFAEPRVAGTRSILKTFALGWKTGRLSW